jgi:hypothetical protein
LNQDGWSDLDSKEAHERELQTLTDQRDEALFLLKKMILDFKIQLNELKNMFALQLESALTQQQVDMTNLFQVCQKVGGRGGSTNAMISVGTQVGSQDGSGALMDGAAEKKKETETPVPKKKKKKKPYKGRTLTLTKVLDIIAGMYEKKIRADIIDDAANKDRDSLAEFAVDFFVQMYGSVMKKKKMDEFRHSIQQHRNSNIRVKWFSTMVGWNEDDAFGIYTPFHPGSADAFLQVLSELFPIDAIEERLDDDPCLVKITAALKALGTDGDGLFDVEYRRSAAFAALVDIFQKNACKKKGSSDKYVDFDLCISNVMRSWYLWKVPQPEPGSEGEGKAMVWMAQAREQQLKKEGKEEEGTEKEKDGTGRDAKGED